MPQTNLHQLVVQLEVLGRVRELAVPKDFRLPVHRHKCSGCRQLNFRHLQVRDRFLRNEVHIQLHLSFRQEPLLFVRLPLTLVSRWGREGFAIFAKLIDRAKPFLNQGIGTTLQFLNVICIHEFATFAKT